MAFQEPLLAEVIRRRDELLMRIVFADWLLDQDDSWGAFIYRQLAERGTVQIHEPVCAGFSATDKLEAEIRQRHAPLVAGKVTAFQFGGGCVERLQLTLPQMLRDGEQLVRSLPIRAVEIRADLDLWKEALQLPLWQPIETLRVSGIWVGVDRVEQLATAPHMKSLHTVQLNGAGVCQHGVQHMLQAPWARGIRCLHFDGNRDIGDRGLIDLVASDRFSALSHLHLRRCAISDRSLRQLTTMPSLAKIRHLDLRDNSVTIAGIDALQRSPFWHRDAELVVDARKRR